MGSILFDFLTESILFRERHLDESYASVPEAELATVLKQYREFCLGHQQELLAEAESSDKRFTLFPGMHSVSLDLLKQSALYVERYVIADPLFKLTEPENDAARAMRSYFGTSENGFEREELALAIRTLKALTPMVAADYVKFLPVSLLFEVPERIPIYYSKTRFAEALPGDIFSYFHEHARVEPLRRQGSRWVSDPGARVARGIIAGFGDDSAEMLHNLFEQRIETLDDVTRTYTATVTLPVTPPEPEYYNAWVDQSINRTAINFLDRVLAELEIALRIGASYICFSRFRSDLLNRFLAAKSGTAQYTANAMINLDLPFVDEIDTESLMKLRLEDGDSFQMFRRELERQLWDLRHEEDPEQSRSKLEKVLHDLGSVQHGLLNLKLSQFRSSAAIKYATLGATVLSTHQFLPGLIAAAGLSLQLKADYDASLRQNPAYFLWKARRLATS